jgi:hypothetical protein
MRPAVFRVGTRLGWPALLFFSGVALAAQDGVSSEARQYPGERNDSRNPYVVLGDEAYSRRQDGRFGPVANPRKISDAIVQYQTAAEAPDNLEARWKLLRALYFKGVYTGLDAGSRKAVFEQARRVADNALTILARRAGRREPAELVKLSPPLRAQALERESDAAATYYWSAVCRGQWALSVGKLDAAREGVAESIRDDAATVVELDPKFEEAGGYRVLGRLHDQAPDIPFLTGWVSKDEAVRYLRLAVAAYPKSFANRHFLAEALSRSGEAEALSEAVKIEESVAADAPSPQHLVEDVAIQDQARTNLDAWRKKLGA